ncbi:MAG: Lrp/AsnC family transcriptional regulator [Candidatus Hydrothermarchaeota archaeon]|nr:MAG: Lrp/AsnC family transcriptional regulator [Candidatus Hydrothermarchaeota archaeon]
MMDDKDRKILELIQEDLPLTKRPFKSIADRLGVAEEEVIDRIKRLKEQGVIRKFGLRIDSQAVGYASTLLAIKVPEEMLDKVAEELCKYESVTHCYAREHEYNLWITIIDEKEKLDELIDNISKRFETLNLPVVRKFKIKVMFDLRSEHGRA